MDKITVTSLNQDGSVAFTGLLNKEQAGYVLGIGISYLLSQGALSLMGDDEEEDWPEPNAPSTETSQ